MITEQQVLGVIQKTLQELGFGYDVTQSVILSTDVKTHMKQWSDEMWVERTFNVFFTERLSLIDIQELYGKR